jgi:hypothetical protein
MAVSALAFAGCVFLQEPYPGWTVIDIRYEDTPRKVRTAFRNDYGTVRVAKVERSTLESRLSGHPKKYRLFFEKADGEIQRVIYDKQGKREDGFEFWFHRGPESAEQKRGANGRQPSRSGCMRESLVAASRRSR